VVDSAAFISVFHSLLWNMPHVGDDTCVENDVFFLFRIIALHLYRNSYRNILFFFNMTSSVLQYLCILVMLCLLVEGSNRAGSLCTLGKMPSTGKWLGFKTSQGKRDPNGDENLFNGMWAYAKRNVKQAAKIYKSVDATSSKQCFHICATEKKRCHAFSYGQKKGRCLLSNAKAPNPYDPASKGTTKWCKNDDYTSGYLWYEEDYMRDYDYDYSN